MKFLRDFYHEIVYHDSVNALVFSLRNKSFYDFWIEYFQCTEKIILLYNLSIFFIFLYQLNFVKSC